MSKHRVTLLLTLAGLLGCSADYHVQKGRDALEKHDLAAAEASYRKALEKDPQSGAALSGLGWTYQIAGQRDAARDAFVQCATVAPALAECLRGQASVALAEGQSAAARDLLNRAIELDPDDPGCQNSMALLEMSQAEYDAASARFESLIARFPDAPEYRVGFAELRLRQKRAEDALQIIDEALALPGTAIRYKSTLWQIQARALVAATSNRSDPRDCAGTAPPVLAWLDAADAAVDRAEASGVSAGDLPTIRRLILRRRGAVQDRCPADGASTAPAAGDAPLPDDVDLDEAATADDATTPDAAAAGEAAGDAAAAGEAGEPDAAAPTPPE